jgi:hypothetical protein
VDALDHWVDAVHPKLLPKSPLRRTTTYAINQRVFFRRCFEDGRFEIDNGRVERRIRNFAVGRRNTSSPARPAAASGSPLPTRYEPCPLASKFTALHAAE